MRRSIAFLFLWLSSSLVPVPLGKCQSPPLELYELPAAPVQVPALSEVLAPAPLSPNPVSQARPANVPASQQAAPDAVREDFQIGEMRAAVQKLGVQRNRFVHCELRNGQVLTGTIVRIEPRAFYVQTDAVGNPHQVFYANLTSSPRPVPAVGTRLKQGLQWTGVGIGLAVGIPLLVVLSPILYFTGVWDC